MYGRWCVPVRTCRCESRTRCCCCWRLWCLRNAAACRPPYLLACVFCSCLCAAQVALVSLCGLRHELACVSLLLCVGLKRAPCACLLCLWTCAGCLLACSWARRGAYVGWLLAARSCGWLAVAVSGALSKVFCLPRGGVVHLRGVLVAVVAGKYLCEHHNKQQAKSTTRKRTHKQAQILQASTSICQASKREGVTARCLLATTGNEQVRNGWATSDQEKERRNLACLLSFT